MRNMSFALTTTQIKHGTKTVTRRYGWNFLKPGDMVRPVYKSMGIKKGEKAKQLRGPLKIISVTREPLSKMIFEKGAADKEGFPHMTNREFVEMLCSYSGKKPSDLVNRIEFEYTDAGAVDLPNQHLESEKK